MWKSTGWFASRYGVTRQTIHRWCKDGKFDKIQKTKGGAYRIWFDSKVPDVIGYCRVSSSKQSSSLQTQANLIYQSYPEARIVKDVGGGFNFNRKGLKTLLEQSLSGSPVKLVATTRDRVTRVGFPLIQWIVELYGGEIIILEDDDEPEESFDTETLIAFITSFINSYYGKRSSRRNKANRDSSEEQE